MNRLKLICFCSLLSWICGRKVNW